jgi:diguanylate cyclase (GGDEF)-like protein/PAS domain S-box-containing protein
MTEKYVILSRNLIRQHAVALVFIVFFSTVSWLNHEFLIRTEQEITLTVKVCESLRMLSQRTALFANLLVNAPEDQKEELRNKLSGAVFLMERSHRALTLGDQDLGLSGKMSPTIYVMYSEGNNPVTNLVKNYIKEIKAFLKLTDAQITGESYQLPTTILLDSLDKMVEQYQVEGDSSIRRINDLGRIFWLITFLLLGLEIVLIFKLFAKDLKAVIARLEEVSNKLTFHRNHLEELVLERTEELRKNQAFTQDILDSVAMEIAVLDQAGKIVAVNEAWMQFAINNGLEPEQIPLRAGIGCNYLEVCGKGASQEISDTAQGIFSVLDSSKSSFEREYPCDSPDQSRWFYMTVSPMKSLGYGAVVTHFDITTRKLTEEKLNKFYAAVMHSSASVIITDKQANIEYVNPRFTIDTGYTADEAIGKNPRMLTSGLTNLSVYESMWSSLADGKPWHGEFINRRKNGETYWEDAYVAPVLNNEMEIVNYVAVITDISERKKLEEEIHKLAFNDELTKLPNRRLLQDRISQLIAASKRNNEFGALIFLDLDNFKPLNDLHGHAAGDLLLIEVSNRLVSCVRNSDTVARLGGDEFVVLLSDLGTDAAVANSKVKLIADKTLNMLSTPYELDADLNKSKLNVLKHHCSASLGVVVFKGDESTTSEALLDDADKAMYEAKESGRNQIKLKQTIH